MDIKLPGMNGIDCTLQAAATPAQPECRDAIYVYPQKMITARARDVGRRNLRRRARAGEFLPSGTIDPCVLM